VSLSRLLYTPRFRRPVKGWRFAPSWQQVPSPTGSCKGRRQVSLVLVHPANEKASAFEDFSPPATPASLPSSRLDDAPTSRRRLIGHGPRLSRLPSLSNQDCPSCDRGIGLSVYSLDGKPPACRHTSITSIRISHGPPPFVFGGLPAVVIAANTRLSSEAWSAAPRAWSPAPGISLSPGGLLR